jgi:hypothetical protein
MSKVRVNFFLPKEVYDCLQGIAEQEASTSAELFRAAVKQFIHNYHDKDLNKFFKNKSVQSIAQVSGADE